MDLVLILIGSSILQVSLEHNMAGVSRSLNGSTGFFPPRMGYNQPSSSSTLIPNGEPVIAEVENGLTDQQSLADEIEHSSHSNGVAAVQSTTQMAIVASPLTLGDSANELSQEEVQNMNEQIEQDLDPDSQVSARELWEDIRSISRKVLRLASKVMRSTHEDTASPTPIATDSVTVSSEALSSTTLNIEEPVKNAIIIEDAPGTL